MSVLGLGFCQINFPKKCDCYFYMFFVLREAFFDGCDWSEKYGK